MNYARNEKIYLDPKHENLLIDDNEDSISLASDPVEIKLLESIYGRKNPLTNYWEIKYLDSTPNREEGDTIVITENKIAKYEVYVEQEDYQDQYSLLSG